MKLQKNGTDIALVNRWNKFTPLFYFRNKIKEQTGLTDLLLVCEDKQELRSTPDERVGHVYHSNDADCSNENYIRGVRMQYDTTKYPNYEPTMVANFAIACTEDYNPIMLQESVLSFFPAVQGGKRSLLKFKQVHGQFLANFPVKLRIRYFLLSRT